MEGSLDSHHQRARWCRVLPGGEARELSNYLRVPIQRLDEESFQDQDEHSHPPLTPHKKTSSIEVLLLFLLLLHLFLLLPPFLPPALPRRLSSLCLFFFLFMSLFFLSVIFVAAPRPQLSSLTLSLSVASLLLSPRLLLLNLYLTSYFLSSIV